MPIVKAIVRQQRLSHWAKIIADCKNSGLSACEYMRRNSITQGAYYYWLNLLRKECIQQTEMPVATNETSSVRFEAVPMHPVTQLSASTPVTIAAELGLSSKAFSSSIHLTFGKAELDIRENTSMELLRKTLAVLQEISS